MVFQGSRHHCRYGIYITHSHVGLSPHSEHHGGLSPLSFARQVLEVEVVHFAVALSGQGFAIGGGLVGGFLGCPMTGTTY